MIRVLFVSLFIWPLCSQAQEPAYVRTYGGDQHEEGKKIIACEDGGYLIVGTTGSEGADTDIYLLRLDDELNCVWNRVLGGPQMERGYAVVEDPFHTFYVCGFTNSQGAGGYDAMVCRVDEDGNTIWEHTYGGTDWDFAYGISRHTSGDLFVAGASTSFGNGGKDGWVFRISPYGDLISEMTSELEGDDEYTDIECTNDQWFVCGNVISGEVQTGMVAGGDMELEVQWTYAPAGQVDMRSITLWNNTLMFCGNWMVDDLEIGAYGSLAFDGTLLSVHQDMNAYTYHSNDIDVVGDKIVMPGGITFVGAGGFDANLLFRNFNHSFFGNPTFGLELDEELYDGTPTPSGGYIATGVSESFNQNAQPQLLVIAIDSVVSGDYEEDYNLIQVCLDVTTDLASPLTVTAGQPVSRRYFDLQGREVPFATTELAPGVYLELSTFTDGSFRVARQIQLSGNQGSPLR